MIKVLFFGPVADRVGNKVLQIEHRAGIDLQELRDECAEKFPQAFELVRLASQAAHKTSTVNLIMTRDELVGMLKKHREGCR